MAMTNKERDAELVRVTAAHAFAHYMHIVSSEAAIRTIVAVYWGHPAFQEYLEDMELREEFERFRVRG